MAIPRKSSPTAADNTSANSSANPSASVSPNPPAAGVEQDNGHGHGHEPGHEPEPSPAAPSQSSVAVAAAPMAPPTPTPYPAVSIPAASTAPVPDDDLPGILRRLTPIQRAKLRSAAISEGVIQSGAGKISSDGSLSVVIRVNSDLVPQLQTWATEAGKSTEEQVREIVDMLLNSYLLSPWEPPQPVAVAADSTSK